MVKKKIIKTIEEARTGLERLNGEFCIIGASAITLSGYDVGDTGDIDILTSSVNADRIKPYWKNRIETDPGLKDSDIFRSSFTRYNFPLMDVEILGDLQIFKEGSWQDVRVEDYTEIEIGGLTIKLPSIEEQFRILTLFGRNKDRERMRLIEEQIKRR